MEALGGRWSFPWSYRRCSTCSSMGCPAFCSNSGTFLCFASSQKSAHLALEYRQFLLEIPACTHFCFRTGRHNQNLMHSTLLCALLEGTRVWWERVLGRVQQKQHQMRLQPPPDAAPEQGRTEQCTNAGRDQTLLKTHQTALQVSYPHRGLGIPVK